MQLSATVATSTSERPLNPGDPLWTILFPSATDSWLWTLTDEGFPTVDPGSFIWAAPFS
jgi:hypothetical protein